MTQLRVGLAQLNPTVGDLAGNAALIREGTAEAAQQGADVVLFPELVLTGCPLEDLASHPAFAQDSRERLAALARELADDGHGATLVILGCLDHDETGPRNAVAALHRGMVVAEQFDHHPDGAFGEHHPTHPGQSLEVLQLHGVNIGMLSGTDLGMSADTCTTLANSGVDLILAPAAIPFERGAANRLAPLLQQRATETGIVIGGANPVGGQDGLVFDGNSRIVDGHGTGLYQAPRFESRVATMDTTIGTNVVETSPDTGGPRIRHHHLDGGSRSQHPHTTPVSGEALSDEAQTWSALVLGLRDYSRKNGFQSTLFGFSGGIDSAVCAALVADALGADALHGVSMPSRYSSRHSTEDAEELAERIGCHFRSENVEDIVADYVTRLQLTGLAEENIQARVRGMLLMAISNMEGHLVLAPANKTELAVGYSTLYGDAVGGFAPLKDVFKTQVWRLARWRNDEANRRGETPPIPERSINKPASAELRPGQADTDSLPEYTLLDSLLGRYLEDEWDRAALVTSGFDTETVDRILRMIKGTEYKRRQYPPGTRVSRRAFDRDRRFPITNAWHETH